VSLLPRFQSTLSTLVQPDQSILIAVSGGLDSCVLLDLCVHSLPRELLGVVHVDHNLRSDSHLDAAFVAEVAKRYGVSFFCRSCTPPGPQQKRFDGLGLEGWARSVRYREFIRLAHQKGFARIATAHTQSDQAETFIARLLRNSGVQGLASIQPRRSDGVIRPLLFASREQVHGYATRADLSWREDSSNTDTALQRNAIRHNLLPALRRYEPQIEVALAAAADACRASWSIAQRWIDATVYKSMVALGDGVCCWEFSPDIDTETLQQLFYRLLSVLDLWPGKKQCEACARIVSGEAGAAKAGGGALSPQITLRVAPGSCAIYRTRYSPDTTQWPAAIDLQAANRLSIGEVDSTDNPSFFTTRMPEANSCFVATATASYRWFAATMAYDSAFAELGGKTLRQFLKSRGVPRQLRVRTPVITDQNGQLVWIPGIWRQKQLQMPPGARLLRYNCTKNKNVSYNDIRRFLQIESNT